MEGLLQQAAQNDPRRTCQGKWEGLAGEGLLQQATQNDARHIYQGKWEGPGKGCYNK